MSILWDTDTVSEYQKKKNRRLVNRCDTYLNTHGSASLSVITRFEVIRGLRSRNAQRQLSVFDKFCSQQVVLPMSEDILEIAADVWADLDRRGQLITDCDIFIAATALHHGLRLVTGNTSDFSRIPGLTLEDWTKP